ncbi:polyribonucleotide nucleotidyltransferase, partial [Candidatus Woesebacteria bacterium]|nr:polyribonucleotide nucleotidyltransferase [Candidatus Woesebacteria bacterium]
MTEIKKTLEIGGRTLTLKTGILAPQATLAVTAQYGDTVVLATVTSAPLRQELDYFPLSVEYQERLYAGGRIKGSRWVKREGRPTDDEILKGRLIDRSIRPLFPKTYKMDVQVIATVLSVDMENDPAMTAGFAVSAALTASSLPWGGPVSILNVGLIDGEYVINPTNAQEESSKMDLIVSATKEAIIMVEAGANEVSEDEVIKGIEFAQKESKQVFDFINEFAKEVGIEKEVVAKAEHDKALVKAIAAIAEDRLPAVIDQMAKKEGKSAMWDELLAEVKAAVEPEQQVEASIILDDMKKEIIRKNILKGVRPDGRKLDQVRVLSSAVGVLPRTHGSALFQRGATQVMNVATIGPLSDGQLLESAEGEREQRYIHHYIMPPFSTGETGRVGQPSRREIGHGALAERALFPVIPDEKTFPYAMRLVSEVLSSNGSTSMASTCGSTLSLMDAGVPIKSPVSGIAMGLVIESDKEYAVMTDIAGIEDFNGDMDFKVAGTKDGITAMQLDVKTLNLTAKILKDAIAQAKVGRAHILKHMLETISEPRSEVSTYAPKVKTVHIDPTKIGEVVGPGGKIIKRIIAETGANVEISDDGSVAISAVDIE